MFYPILVDLTDKQVLVVGGGTVARRKVQTLLEFGARVLVVSPEVEPEIIESDTVRVLRREYHASDLEGCAMVIAGTDERDVNTRVSDDAKRANLLVNVVDVPDLCGFIVPANVRRGDLIISVSTLGKSPGLTRLVRERIEEIFGPEYGELTDLMGEIREIAKERIATQAERESVFKEILGSEVLYLLGQGRKEEAHALAMGILSDRIPGGAL